MLPLLWVSWYRIKIYSRYVLITNNKWFKPILFTQVCVTDHPSITVSGFVKCSTCVDPPICRLWNSPKQCIYSGVKTNEVNIIIMHVNIIYYFDLFSSHPNTVLDGWKISQPYLQFAKKGKWLMPIRLILQAIGVWFQTVFFYDYLDQIKSTFIRQFFFQNV